LLILLEGLPGSGKSTTGQRLQEHLGVRWVSEMQPDHPIYAFHDRASLNAMLGDLAAGKHEAVIERAVAKWSAFASSVRESGHTHVLDSCLFGYLTWTLYPHFDVGPAVVRAYLDRVIALLEPLAPRLIYLRPRDLPAALERIRPARGGQMLEGYEKRAVESPFGRKRGLVGFDGLVSYWQAWREIADDLFERLPFAKLALDTTNRDWPAYDTAISAFLAVSPLPPTPRLDREELAGLVGTYVDPADSVTCRITIEDGTLVAYDLPGAFPRNPLIPAGAGRFQAEAWAFGVLFERHGLTIDAHEWSSRPRVMRRESS
jgi:hypothetical protein